jgi:hypothetical protein
MSRASTREIRSLTTRSSLFSLMMRNQRFFVLGLRYEEREREERRPEAEEEDEVEVRVGVETGDDSSDTSSAPDPLCFTTRRREASVEVKDEEAASAGGRG